VRPLQGLRALVRHLRTEHATPGRLAAAVALGLFVGCLPVYGLHLPLCLGLALALRLNKATTYLAANVSNPLFLPFLVFASVQIGTRTISGAWLPLGLHDLEAVGARRFLGAWILGSGEVGALLAAIGGAATLRLARGRRDPFEPRVRQIGLRYRTVGPFVAGFVAGKLRGDPFARFVAENAGAPARATDVGCGFGQIATLLSLEGAGEVVGLDWDARRLAAARAAATGLAVRFEEADLREGEIPPGDLVILADVLHYLPPDAQDHLLARAAAAVRPGGRIWVREMVRGMGLRSGVGIASERLLAVFSWNRARTLSFRSADAIAGALRAAGIPCEIREMSAGTPFANVLVEGRKAPAET
jgi:uncharacterized protein (DUF2062 family)/2-polyprenyl-3-methyl-5-hydroxy-6-metoxy-1,4-benzoquinol methylase